MSTPREPYQPGQPDAGSPAAPQQQPMPPQQPPAQYAAQPGPAQPPAQPASGPHYAGAQYGAPPPSPEGPYAGQRQASGQYAAPAQSGTPGQDTNPFGLPGQQPPAESRKNLWIILGSAGGVLLLVIIGLIILVNVVGSATNQARGLADDFTKLVISGDAEQAYDYLDPGLHDQLTKESFSEGIATLELNDSCKPVYDDVKVTSADGTNSADISGLITCDGAKKVELAYRFEGQDELKMINIKLRPQE